MHPPEKWSVLPAECARTLREQRPGIVAETIVQIQQEIPEYSRPAYAGTIRNAVEATVDLWCEPPHGVHGRWRHVASVFHRLGHGEAVEGRELEELQSAMRLGVRILLRRLMVALTRSDVDPDVLVRVGDVAMANLDLLVKVAAEGYAEARARAGEELARRRQRLLTLILADRPVLPAVAEAARALKWRLPANVAAVLVEGVEPDGPDPPLILPPDILVDQDGPEPILLLPDPDSGGQARLLDRSLRGRRAAMGPTVPLADASISLRRARDLLALAQDGVIEDTGVLRYNDHLGTLLVFSDPELARFMAETHLAPLMRLDDPMQVERLAETLLVWLQCAGNANMAAEILHVHPQTIRYRMKQLEPLFGDRLHDPGRRWELEAALRARRIVPP
ncbi:MAG TPA: helix-turn-helix domain-containing protein [Thermomonospora sp.]|nr:helix-turn-helix domain-containing protein [Thermomonospora sp.]